MRIVAKKQAAEAYERKLHRLRRYREINQVWSLDTEFQEVNKRPIPVCLCAKELLTGERIEMFFHAGEQPANPFDDYEHSIFLGHNLAAEWSVFIVMGWELPPHCVDTMFEFACLTNGKLKRDLETRAAPKLRLLDACEYFGVTTMDYAAKTNERENIIANGRVAPHGVKQVQYERRVMDYCWEDVHQTADLFTEMIPLIDSAQAMLRGSYSRPVAYYQGNGLPLNFPFIKKVVKYRDHLKLELIRRIEQQHGYGAYIVDGDEAKFSLAGASEMVRRLGLTRIWPRTEKTGQFSFATDIVSDLAKSYEVLRPFHEMRKTDSDLKNFVLQITNGGYNRPNFGPFNTKTGRNNPWGGFILAGPKWLRFGIQAPPGHVLIVCDVKSEEYVIAAAFGDDQEQLEPYYAGEDLYMKLAKRRNVVPEDANHETEPDEKKRNYYVMIRKLHKVVALAGNYGQRAPAVSRKLGVSLLEAQVLEADIALLNKKWWDFIDSQIGAARKRGYIETTLGWKMWVYPEIRRGPRTLGTKTTTMINWPIQAAGAEIMRLASIFLERGGFGPYLCVPHHDAIYACAPMEKVRDVAVAIEAAFSLAGEIVLDGKARLRMDTKFYPCTQTYEDKDGVDLFRIVDDILAPLPGVTDEEWAVLHGELETRIEANRRKKQGLDKAG